MSQNESIPELIETCTSLLREQGRTLATIESCTGGLLGAAITELPGVSDIYLGGFITYANLAKQMTAGVNPRTLIQHGAVSSQTAVEMAMGGCGKLLATNSIAITGIAGPSGGTPEKPVGTVWICVAQSSGEFDCRRFVFPGDRVAVRENAVLTSLQMMIQQLCQKSESLTHEQERISA
tara:strand:+ start:358600 stop:359136 length:537 start_codon:yes stop_codon:yes gene_type:complete